jgi:hypothetical protein
MLQIGNYNLNILHNLHIILLFIKVQLNTLTRQYICTLLFDIISKMLWLRPNHFEGDKMQGDVCKRVIMQENARYAPLHTPDTVAFCWTLTAVINAEQKLFTICRTVSKWHTCPLTYAEGRHMQSIRGTCYSIINLMMGETGSFKMSAPECTRQPLSAGTHKQNLTLYTYSITACENVY